LQKNTRAKLKNEIEKTGDIQRKQEEIRDIEKFEKKIQKSG